MLLCVIAKGLVMIPQRVTRPKTDVVLVLPVKLIGSQPRAAMVFASSAHSFLTLFSSPRQHIFSKEEPNGFEDLCRGFAVFHK
jgi:hypothetical protein